MTDVPSKGLALSGRTGSAHHNPVRVWSVESQAIFEGPGLALGPSSFQLIRVDLPRIILERYGVSRRSRQPPTDKGLICKGTKMRRF